MLAILPIALAVYAARSRHGRWIRCGLWIAAVGLALPAALGIHLMIYAAGHWPCDGLVWPPFNPARWPSC